MDRRGIIIVGTIIGLVIVPLAIFGLHSLYASLIPDVATGATLISVVLIVSGLVAILRFKNLLGNPRLAIASVALVVAVLAIGGVYSIIMGLVPAGWTVAATIIFFASIFIAGLLLTQRSRLTLLLIFVILLIVILTIWITGTSFNTTGITLTSESIQTLVIVITLLVLIAVLAFSIIANRQSDLVEERFLKSEQIDFYDIETEFVEEKPSLRQLIMEAIDSSLDDRTFGNAVSKQLTAAGLNLTVAEWFMLHIVCGYALFSISYLYLFPDILIPAILVGVVGLFIPSIWGYWRQTSRLQRFEAQWPFILELMTSHVQTGKTLAQAFGAVANHAPRFVAEEFQRVLMDSQLGSPLTQGVKALQDRIPSPVIGLLYDVVYLHENYRSPLSPMLADLLHHTRRTQEIRLQLPVLAYVHNLLFPLVVGLLFLQTIFLRDYFAGLNDAASGLLLFACGLITVGMLLAGESGKQLSRIHKQHGLVSYRSPTLNMCIRFVRIIAFLMFLLYQLSQPPLSFILWGWLMLLLLETPYAVVPIVIIGVVVTMQLGVIFPVTSGASDLIPSAVMMMPDRTNATVSLSTDSMINTALFPLFFLVFLTFVSGLIYIALRENRGHDPLQERLGQYGEFSKGITLREVELALSFRDRVLIPIFTQFGHLLAGFTPNQQVESIQMRLERAGGGVNAVVFQLARILLGIFFGGLVYGVLLDRSGIAGTVVLPILLIAVITGAYIPVAILNARIRSRKQAIQAELPELALRLEMRCKGNLTLMSTLESLYMAWDSLVALQMGRVLREIQLGKDTDYAVHDMAERVDLLDMKYLAAALASLQNNMDGLQLFIGQYRQQLYLNRAEYIRRAVRPYQMCYHIAWHYGILVGLALWLLTPLLGQ